jgi:hypothetical protein
MSQQQNRERVERRRNGVGGTVAVHRETNGRAILQIFRESASGCLQLFAVFAPEKRWFAG